MKLEDSHEWMMWQAMQRQREKGEPSVQTIYSESECVAIPDTYKVEVPLREPSKQTYMKKDKASAAWAARLQKRVNAWVKGKDDTKLEELLGYSRAKLRRHLERQFTRGMSWDNYAGNSAFNAKRVWVIDHIVPKRLFREEEASNAFHITNLRPLWISENMTKNMKRLHLI